MTKESERIFLLECIKLYRELPALWKVKSPEYNNRMKKNNAYDTLVAKFQEKYQDITREEVKRKFNSLRTNFRKEVKKVFDSKKPGAEVYIPTLWYYDEMLFLIEHEMSTQTIIFMQENDENDSESDSGISKIKKPLPPPKKTKLEEDSDTGSSLPYKIPCEPADEYDKIGAAWACELRKIDPVQQIFAKKAISDVLFEGQLGTLSRNSVIINSPPPTMVHRSFAYTNSVTHHST